MSTVMKTEQSHRHGGDSCTPGNLRRALFAAAGTVCVALGLLGALLPVLPTTPFLLLAAACYIRGSDRLYRRLLTNRLFGEHLRRYRAGEGLPRAFKIWTIMLLWATLSTSAFFVVPPRLWWIRMLLLSVGIGVTIHLRRIPTFSARDGEEKRTRS